MADDPSKRGPQDRSRINTNEDYEVRYWSDKFGVSAEQLKAAVKKVGNSAEAVEREFKGGLDELLTLIRLGARSMRQLQLHVFLPVLLAEAGCLAIDRDPVASYARHNRRLTLFRRLLEADVAQSGKSKWLSPHREALLETDTPSNLDHRNSVQP
jgi:hypothetical protein